MIATATRPMHMRHVSRRASSYLFVVQRVEPALDGLRLCPCHADDESGLRDGPADFHGRCDVEYRLDVDR
jgi:hypothetical protein